MGRRNTDNHFSRAMSVKEREILSRIERARKPIGAMLGGEQALFHSAWVKSAGRILRSSDRRFLGGWHYWLNKEHDAPG